MFEVSEKFRLTANVWKAAGVVALVLVGAVVTVEYELFRKPAEPAHRVPTPPPDHGADVQRFHAQFWNRLGGEFSR